MIDKINSELQILTTEELHIEKLWYLSQISLFKMIPNDDLMIIDEMSYMKTLSKKYMIQRPEQFQKSLYLLKKGKIRLYKLDQDGKQFTLGILGSGNIFGEIESFSLGTRDVYIETLEETLLCTINQELIQQFLLERPKLMLKLLQVLSERLIESNRMLEHMALGDTKDRLLYLLVKLSEQFGTKKNQKTKIDIKLTHQELAYMIGSTRESVSIMLKELTAQKLVSTNRKSITINNSLLDEDY